MRLLYEGVDITDSVEINKAVFIDAAGGQADSLELRLNDTEGLWSKWKPEQNHKVEIGKSGLKTGTMFIDEMEQVLGFIIIRALSVPQESKTVYSRSWEEISFLELIEEIAARYGFLVRTYGIQNYVYRRVDQINQTDIEFLSWRCLLEGYSLKITNKTLIVFNERLMEKEKPVKTFYPFDFDKDYRFWKESKGVFSACQITYGNIKGETRDPNLFGPIKKLSDLYVTSIGEAERFSAGILRSLNKNSSRGLIKARFNSGITAGNMVEIKDVGLFDGDYLCQKAIHEFTTDRVTLKLRRPLEVY